MKENDHVANEIIHKLKKHGVVIQKYDAKSSNSIYLKLDYGLAGSIRISDHHSKNAHWPYRYNILKIFSEPMNITSPSGHTQYFYSWKDMNLMIEHILKDRIVRRNSHGVYKYNYFMIKSKADHTGKRGFWQNCKEV